MDYADRIFRDIRCDLISIGLKYRVHSPGPVERADGFRSRAAELVEKVKSQPTRDGISSETAVKNYLKTTYTNDVLKDHRKRKTIKEETAEQVLVVF